MNSIEIPLQGTGGISVGYVDMNKIFGEYPPVKTAKKDYEKIAEQKKLELSGIDSEISVIKSSCTDLETQIKQLKQESMALKVQKQRLSVQMQQPQIQTQQPTPPISSSAIVSVSTGTVPVGSSSTLTIPAISTATGTNSISVSTQAIQTEQPGLSIQAQYDKVNSTIEADEKQISEKETDLVLKKDLITKKQQEYTDYKKKNEKDLKEYEKNKTLALMGELYKIIEDLAKEENISIVIEKTNVLYGSGGIDLTNKILERLRGK